MVLEAFTPTIVQLGCYARRPLTAVVGLFLASCPFAIRWVIRAVIVYAFQCRVFGTCTHVGKEGWKAVNPTVTNLDAPASPVLVAGKLGIKTSGLHAIPRRIFRALWVGTPVNRVFFAYHFRGDATTRFAYSSPQRSSMSYRLLSAFATAMPVTVARV
jgi:hypothetical protein